MSRLYAPIVALLVLVACSVARPLYEPELEPAVAPAEVALGKGFVSTRGDGLAPPISLTASDGSGLRLRSMKAEAIVDDPLAVTDLELAFVNPNPEVIEGKLELALPPGAAITKFAMMIEGKWQEAAIVDRQRGREVYETFLHQQRDPALLEQEIGNRFSVRVFPIPASGEVNLRVSWVQTFDEPTLPYRLALRGLPSIGELATRVGVHDDAGEIEWTEHHLERQRPREDLVVPRRGAAQAAWRSGNHVIARVTLPEASETAKPPRSIAILFDTSASRAIDFAGKREQLGDVIEQLARHVAPETRLVVLPFDQSIGAAVYTGPLSGFAQSDAQSRLARRHALGASDLERALMAAAAQKAERVVVVTDGMITAGARKLVVLRGALQSVAKAGTQRLDVVAGRDRRDDDVLRTLTTRELPQAGVVIDAARSPEDIALRLVRPTAAPTRVRIAGARKVWPATLKGMQAGDAALVYAEMPRATRTLDVTLDVEGTEPLEQRVDVIATETHALTRAWMRADVGEQLAALGGTTNATDPALRKRLSDLSVEYGLLNELTAMIVLETDEDYARFGIERAADPTAANAGPPEGSSGEHSQRSHQSVSMQEHRNIPIGASESRDFTQVVESSATGSRDSGGISLSGTTGAESRYRVEGANIDNPRFRAVARHEPVPIATVRRYASRGRGGLRTRDAREKATRYRVDLEHCWHAALRTDAALRGGLFTVELHIDANGRVDGIDLLSRLAAPTELRRCMDAALRAGRFPTGGASRRARYTFELRPGEVPPAGPVPQVDPVAEALVDPDRNRTDEGAYVGTFLDLRRKLKDGDLDRAEEMAWTWRRSSPDDIMALVALGEVAEARGRRELAARAYGSIAELYPSNAAMLRFAAGRLEALGTTGLAVGVLREAQRQRPDHPSSHRALAWAFARRGRFEDAFEALAAGYDNDYPDGRFASARAELGEELRILGAAWLRAQPKRRREIEARLVELGLSIADEPSLRFVLTWETDTNDVDLHIQDSTGSRAWYRNPTLPSGGSLLADVTTGFGPESFVIDGDANAFPYYLIVHYYSRGPMGYGMGNVQVIHHDGAGNLDIETLPFVAMKDDAKVLVGAVEQR
jgi:hypothetical protein